MGAPIPAQALRHAELVAALRPDQGIEALHAVDRGVRRLVMARLRSHFPHASDPELVVRHVARLHGADVARCVYGAPPADPA